MAGDNIMAKPAAQIRTEVEALHPGAVVAERGRDFLRFDLGGGKFAYSSSLAPLHVAGSETEIDTDLVTPSGRAEWVYRIGPADFEAFAVRTGAPLFSDGQTHLYKSGATEIGFQPMTLQYTNDLSQLETISNPLPTPAVVAGDTINYIGAYGVGRDYKITFAPGRIQKLLTLASKPPTPNGTILGGGNPVMRVSYILSRSSGLTLWVDGVQWTEGNNQDVRTTSAVEFRDSGGATVGWLPKAWARGSGKDQKLDLEYNLRRQGNSRFVEIYVPWAWLDSVTYPVTIDPTIDQSVAASADDSYQSDENTNSPSGTSMNAWQDGGGFTPYFAARWAVSVAGGVTVDTAKVSWYCINWTTMVSDVSMIAEDSVGAFSSSAGHLGGKSRTGTPTSWSATLSTSTYNDSPEIKTHVQAVLDRGGWSSGNYMGCLIKWLSGGDFELTTYDNSTSQAPKLYFEYTEGGGGGGPGAIMTTNRGLW